MIPDKYDKYVMDGIGALWALGFVIWGLRARKRRQPTGVYIRGLFLAAVGMIVCLIAYTGYVLARQDYEKGEEVASENNLKALSLALLQYAQDHNDHLPPANAWATDIEPYVDKSYNSQFSQIVHDPGVNSPYTYAFNRAVGGLSLDSTGKPSDTVILFEADAKTINSSGTSADFVTNRRMEGGYCAFADGNVHIFKSAAGLNWKP